MRLPEPLRELRVELALAAALWVWHLLFLGHIGLFDVDEAVFAECTREMVVSGDYITPHYNGGVRWDKPPFTYWVMAPSIALLGPTPFAARLAAATEAAALALLLMLFGRSVFGILAGRVAGVVLGTSLHGFLLAHWSATDMLLTTLTACGWMALFWAAERRSPRWFLAAAAALALATLTKGPVALVLPGASWLLWLAWRRELVAVLSATRCWWGFLLYAALLAPWCLAIYARHGTDFFAMFLGYHNLDRLTRAQSGHGAPVWYFAGVVLGGLLPWSGLLLSGLGGAWRRRREATLEGRAGFYLLLWAAVVFGLFSASQTKLMNYIAPLYPAAALLAGAAAARLAAGRGRGWPLLLGAAGLSLVGAATLALPAVLPKLDLVRTQLELTDLPLGPGPLVAGGVTLLAALVPAALWLRGRRRAALAALAVAGAVAGQALWLGVAPVVYHYQQGTLRVMASEAARHLGADGELVTLNVHQPSLVFVTRRFLRRETLDPTRPNEDLARLTATLRERFQGERRVLLITRANRREGILVGFRYFVWARRHGWELIGNTAPPPAYRLPPSPWTERQARSRSALADAAGRSAGSD